MGRFAIIFVFALCIGTASNAQMFGWGLNMGVGFSTVTGTYSSGTSLNSDAEIIPGYVLGGFFKYRPRRFLSLATGFNLISKGTNINANTQKSGFTTTTGQLRLTYFEVPLLVQFNFNPYSTSRPNLYIGPSLSWQLRASDNFTVDYYGDGIPDRQEVGKYYTTFDPGIIIGGGVDMDIAEWTILSLGMRYTHGLNNITVVSDGVFVPEGFEMFNRHFAITMGLTWVIPTYTMNNPGKRNKRPGFQSKKPSQY